jgi:hypothetical protein
MPLSENGGLLASQEVEIVVSRAGSRLETISCSLGSQNWAPLFKFLEINLDTYYNVKYILYF